MDIADPLRRFSDDDLRLVEQISLQIATAIEIARNFELAENRAGRERMVSEMTSRMRERLDVQSVLQTAVNEFYSNFNLDEASLFLTSAQGGPAQGDPTLLAESPPSTGTLRPPPDRSPDQEAAHE